MVSRVERTRYANWWWTVDRLMLAALAVLMLTGIVLSLAASPAVASRIGLDAFYFVNRQAMFLVPSLVVMIATSFLAPRQIRRVALVVFVIALAMTAATLFFGAEVKGARRWRQITNETLRKIADALLSESAIGPYGNVARHGLAPLPAQERIAVRNAFGQFLTRTGVWE